MDDLRGKTFVYGVPGQVQKFMNTRKAVADYVRWNYGTEMWKLVWHEEETEFEDPKMPAENAKRPEIELFRMKMSRKLDKEEQYMNDKGKVFGIVVRQCHVTLKNKIENHEDYDQMEKEGDVIGLLKLIKEIIYGTENNQYEYWTMQASVCKLLSMSQGSKESLLNFGKRFVAQLKVTEEVWGKMIPYKMKGKPTEEQENARSKYLACVFLAGVDSNRYKKVVDDLNNDFLVGKVSYPKDIAGMINLLNNSRGTGDENKYIQAALDGSDDGTSFGQTETPQRGIKCFYCKKRGHISRFCYKRKEDQKKKDKEEDNDMNANQVPEGSLSRSEGWSD
jgi:hypothetical protein